MSRAALWALLIWAPLASGAYRGWPLAIGVLLLVVALAAWVGAMLADRRLEWRRTPLDLPLTLLIALVLVQLSLGHRPLVQWALAPPPPAPQLQADFPVPFWGVGTVFPAQTLRSLLLFALYAAVYWLVVQHLRTRRQVGRLVRMLLLLGALHAFVGLLDYLTGETWLLSWRDHPQTGRVTGTFVNPDHFATWLAMLICLGVGGLVTRTRGGRPAPSITEILASRGLREEAARRYLPLVGLTTMTVAMMFTLSRGGVLSLGLSLLAVLALLGVIGRARRSLVITGALLVVTAGYGSWIGFDPLLARFVQTGEGAIDRLSQYVASLPMLKEFPLFGVGLGAYREIYFRYQPLAHRPHEVYYPYAHNDVLQFVVETGVVGTALGAFLLLRVAADLVGAHLFGRGACPVDGGTGPDAQRNDPYSVGIAIGALGGALVMLAHSALDFGLRIPANGILVATLLGLATVALHTRLVPGKEQLLTAVTRVEIRGRVGLAAGALAIAGFVLLGAWGTFAVRGAIAAGPSDDLGRTMRAADAEFILAFDPSNIPARMTRALTRQAAAIGAWEGTSGGAGVEERRRVASRFLAEGREELRAALAIAPTNPFAHHYLAWLEAVDAVVSERRGAEGLAPVLAHAARAVALAPENPRLYLSTARLAATLPRLGLQAAREAVRRSPVLLPDLIDVYRGVGLTHAEWLTLVPETSVDRLALATRLDELGLAPESLAVYRAALDIGTEAARPLLRWMLGLALERRGQDAAGQSEIAEALRLDPGNPELSRALGEVEARRGDPAALDSFKAAVDAASARAQVKGPPAPPFAVKDPRLLALGQKQAGPDWTRPARYRRALARYLLERRLWEQAAREWESLTLADAGDAEAQFSLGVALDGMGLATEALDHLRRAVALDPTATRYRTRLAQRLWETEQFFQAINEWRTIKSQAPKSLDARLALARAYERIGERADAFREYREILELEPGHAGAVQGLARLGVAPKGKS